MLRFDDTVRIKASGVVGTITDISSAAGGVVYVVEADAADEEYDGIPAVYFCTEEELEKVSS